MNQTMQRIADKVSLCRRTLHADTLFSVRPVQNVGHLYTVVTNETTVQVIYRGTVVAVLTAGSVTLHTRGWQTMTTKNVMNAALAATPFSVYQRDFTWYIHDYRADTDIRFYEGVELYA